MVRRSRRKSRRFARGVRRTGRRLRRTIRKTVRSMAETKYHIQQFDNVSVQNQYFYYTFTDGLATGVGSRDRVGNSIKMKRIGFRMQLNYNRGTDPNLSVRNLQVRVIVAYPREGLSNSADWRTACWANPSFLSYIAPEVAIVMYDKIHTVSEWNPQYIGGTPYPLVKTIKWSKRWGQNVNYRSATQAEVEPVIFVVANSINNGAAYSSCEMDLVTRMSFKDV